MGAQHLQQAVVTGTVGLQRFQLDPARAEGAAGGVGEGADGGGTAKKPVGTVVFAQALRGGDPEDVKAERHEFGDIGRGGIRLQAALLALELLLP